MDIELIKLVFYQLNNSGIKYFEYKNNENSLKIVQNDVRPNSNSIIKDQIAYTKQEKDKFKITSSYVGISILIDSKTCTPFVTLGQAINKGDILCMIDFLNICIEIKSPHNGIISDICVKNNALVDYGKTLFLITC